MADPEPTPPDAEAAEPQECMPCRGTGQVASFLGGERSEESCPWCEGTGRRTAGVDAQAHWQPAAAAVDSD
jgi:hypothetical protein